MTSWSSAFRPAQAARAQFVAAPLPRLRGPGTAGEPAAAEPDPEERERAAYQRGLEAGRAELPFRDAETLRTACDALEVALRELREARSAALEAQRDAVLELALAVAARLLERELTERPDALVPLVERALAQLADAGPVALVLSPGDLDAVRAGGAPALERIASTRIARLEGDARLRPGEARLHAGAASVDMARAAVLGRFREALDGLAAEGLATDGAESAT